MFTNTTLYPNRIFLSVFDSLPCNPDEINHYYKDVQRKANKLALLEIKSFFDKDYFINTDSYIDYNSIKTITQWPVNDEPFILELVGYIRNVANNQSIKFNVEVLLS